MKSVYLCGFMGCGKSHVGKKLAARLNMEFADLDAYIVEREGRSIPQIFAEDGEPHFRELEAKYIGELNGGCVVATGGGALINENTAAFANENGVTVFLDAPFEVCYERIKGDTNRPLVVNNTKEQLLELFNRRRVIYRKNSAVCVEIGSCSGETIERILDKIGTSA